MGNPSSSLISHKLKKLLYKFTIPTLLLLSLFLSLLLNSIYIENKEIISNQKDLETKTDSLYENLRKNREKISQLQEKLELLGKTTFVLPDNDIQEVLSFVSSSLKIEEKSLPKIRYISREEFSSELKSDIDKNQPKEEDIDNTRIILQTFGLISKEKNNKEILSELVESQANFPIAFYDPAKDELTFIRGLTSSKVYYKYILAHELTHFIQVKRLDINKRKQTLETGDTDKYYSFLAIVEGIAESIADKYVESLNDKDRKELQNAIREVSNLANVQNVSKFDQLWGEFVYLKGFGFVKAIQKLENPSTFLQYENITSEIIYNPESFISQDRKVRDNLKVDFNFNTEFTLSEDDIFGQFGCNIIIYSYKDKNSSICSGWNGDKIKLYKKDGKFVIIYVSAWDSQNDLNEAKKAFDKTFTDLDLNFQQQIKGDFLLTVITNVDDLNFKNEFNKIIIK